MFAPAPPVLPDPIFDKAEMHRLMNGYAIVLAESKALSTWKAYAPHWQQFLNFIGMRVSIFYTFQQIASLERLPRAYGMHLWEIHSNTQEVLMTACSAVNFGMELQAVLES